MSDISNIILNETILPFGGWAADDDWVSCWLQINGTGVIVAGGTYIVDLVDKGVLPNDNYDYEILLSMWNWTTATSGQQSQLWVFGGPDTEASRMRVSMCTCIPRTAASKIQGSGCIFPLINGNKKLCVHNAGGYANSSWGLQIGGYRRLGTNI